jgi:glucokinase
MNQYFEGEIKMKLYLGIDIGASGFKYGIGNSKYGLQHFSTLAITEKSTDAFKQINRRILAEASAWNIAGIGIGCPGTIMQPEGKILGKNPNIAFLCGISPAELLPEELDIPVFVDNDANLMALAEASLKNCALCVGITVGSGIGCGIVMNGDIFHGAHGFAAEFGHSIVYPGGELCSCGQRGCVEAYSSVDGIRRRLQDLGSRYAGMALPNMIRLRKRIPELDSVISQGEEALSLGLANLCAILDPDVLILGGGAMDLGLYNPTRIEQRIKGLIPPAIAEDLSCTIAGFGNRAGVAGGILLCERKLLTE